MPKEVKRMLGGDYDGENYDKSNTDHVAALSNGGAVSLYDRTVMEIRCAIYVEGGLIWESESPYNHKRFPFIPVWAYRRSRDNAPYSPVRTMRDSQDSLNKRGSKALWIISSNRVTMEEGAYDDIEELREEASRPDSIIVHKKGYKLELERDLQLADEHLKLMDRDQLQVALASLSLDRTLQPLRRASIAPTMAAPTRYRGATASSVSSAGIGCQKK